MLNGKKNAKNMPRRKALCLVKIIENWLRPILMPNAPIFLVKSFKTG